MVLLISLCLAFLIVRFGKTLLKKRAGLCYGIACAVSLGVVAFVYSGASQNLSGIPQILANVFLQGGLAGALFIFVMYAGAVPDKSAFRKTVMPLRGPLSILASILTLGHNIAYGKTYFVYLFTQASSLRLNVLLAAVCSLIMIAIMLPLFVTSFLRIRKKMQPKRWKKLQRLAYVFYALMFIHVLLLNTTGAREGKWTAILNIALYALLFLVYASLRLCRWAQKNGREGWMAAIQLICSALMIGGLTLIFMPVKGDGTAIQATEVIKEIYEEPDAWVDGKYKGDAIGYNGRLTVSVVVKDGKISRAVCTGNVEDEPYITNAIEGVLGAMVEKNTTNVDTVSSATTTSDALIEAVRKALDQAK
ncbi:MAG: FMN-binding protein [Clostridia bacterium]|nr:FMN-binding protein [Clostridia bacterium]